MKEILMPEHFEIYADWLSSENYRCKVFSSTNTDGVSSSGERIIEYVSESEGDDFIILFDFLEKTKSTMDSSNMAHVLMSGEPMSITPKPYIPIFVICDRFLSLKDNFFLISSFPNIVDQHAAFETKKSLMDFIICHNHTMPRYGHDADDSGRETTIYNRITPYSPIVTLSELKQQESKKTNVSS